MKFLFCVCVRVRWTDLVREHGVPRTSTYFCLKHVVLMSYPPFRVALFSSLLYLLLFPNCPFYIFYIFRFFLCPLAFPHFLLCIPNLSTADSQPPSLSVWFFNVVLSSSVFQNNFKHKSSVHTLMVVKNQNKMKLRFSKTL